MRCVTVLAIAVATVPAWGQPKSKQVILADKIAKDGTRVGNVYIAVTGKERPSVRNGVSITRLELTFRFVAAVSDKRVVVISWDKEGDVAMTDDLGNKYTKLPRDDDRGLVGASVYSDQPFTTHLDFDRPVPKAKTLTLELSGENIGVTNKFITLTLQRTKIVGEWQSVKPKEEKKP